MRQSSIWVFTLIIVLLTGCIKDKTTSYTGMLYNLSEHEISILFYKNGVVYSGDTIKLAPSDSFLLGKGSDYGELDGPGFDSHHVGGPNDSAVVVFDNSYTVTHYFNTPPLHTDKHYLFESLRNIANPLSYEFEMIRNKEQRLNIHRYYFTDDDYEFAKE